MSSTWRSCTVVTTSWYSRALLWQRRDSRALPLWQCHQSHALLWQCCDSRALLCALSWQYHDIVLHCCDNVVTVVHCCVLCRDNAVTPSCTVMTMLWQSCTVVCSVVTMPWHRRALLWQCCDSRALLCALLWQYRDTVVHCCVLCRDNAVTSSCTVMTTWWHSRARLWQCHDTVVPSEAMPADRPPAIAPQCNLMNLPHNWRIPAVMTFPVNPYCDTTALGLQGHLVTQMKWHRTPINPNTVAQASFDIFGLGSVPTDYYDGCSCFFNQISKNS